MSKINTEILKDIMNDHNLCHVQEDMEEQQSENWKI